VLAYRRGPDTTPGPGEVGAGGGGAGEQRILLWLDRSGRPDAAIGAPGPYAGIDLSPDGRRFAVHRHEGAGGDTWFFDLAQGRMQRLTFDASQENASPVWSPDGCRIAFGSRRNNKWGLYVKPVDGTAPEELIVESDAESMPMSWAPDGKLLVYMQDTGAGDVWVVSLDDKKSRPLLQAPYVESSPQVSPDGKWLAYASVQTGRAEIYVTPFPEGTGGPWQVSTDGGQFPRWRGDGRELYFYFQNSLIAADIRVTGSSVDPGVPRTLFRLPSPNLQADHANYVRYAVAGDGQRFLFSLSDAGGGRGGGGLGGGAVAGSTLADAIAGAVDSGQSGLAVLVPNTTPVTVVLNWPRMLGRK
jgi:Tol biopolymer transport system component